VWMSRRRQRLERAKRGMARRTDDSSDGSFEKKKEIS
jgi:hypothetical protein